MKKKQAKSKSAATDAAAMQAAQPVSPGTYTANTDGFLIGSVNFPAQSSQLCITWIWGWNSDGVQMGALGGNVGMFNSSWQNWQSSNPQSFTLPVRNGTTFGCSVQESASNEVNAPTSFWWIATGASSTGKSFAKTSKQKAPQTGKASGAVRSGKKSS